MYRRPEHYADSTALIDLAVASVRAFVGEDASRESARRAMYHWQHEAKLTEDQRRHVLDHFHDDTHPRPGVHYLPEVEPPFVADLVQERFGEPVRGQAA